MRAVHALSIQGKCAYGGAPFAARRLGGVLAGPRPGGGRMAGPAFARCRRRMTEVDYIYSLP
jgi:hypothetical protein